VEGDMLSLYNGHLPTEKILADWYNAKRDSNCGAYASFVGIIRDEDSIDGLSFDVYEPILKKWFDKWQEVANSKNATIYMSHSIGDVLLHETSFICAIFSPKRRVALEMLDEFVEDFKANAPIWKYDLRDGKRVYAEDRSQIVDGGGLLV
jgi:molybdopterin synthase catalytic subunit